MASAPQTGPGAVATMMPSCRIPGTRSGCRDEWSRAGAGKGLWNRGHYGAAAGPGSWKLARARPEIEAEPRHTIGPGGR